jgi:DNA repair protein RecO (recombination protein O)
MIQATKAIVLKTIKYGETSLIVTLYTQLYGVQSCLVQGVRKSTKKTPAKSSAFAVGNLLQISLYYQPIKKLQRIRDFQFDKINIDINTSIVKNAILVLMMELVHHTIQEPEPNSDLYDWLENYIVHIELSPEQNLTWMPHYFCVQYAQVLGFGIHGNYSEQTPILHLQDGIFVAAEPNYNAPISKAPQSQIINILNEQSLLSLSTMQIASNHKRVVLHDLITYFQLHISQMPAIKSISVLESIFS